MEKDIIIIAFENITKEGVTLILNNKTSLKNGNIINDKFWVSWDKIGKLLFDGYTEKIDVSERNKLRNS